METYIYINLLIAFAVSIGFLVITRGSVGYIQFLAIYFIYSHVLRGFGIILNGGSVLYNRYFSWDAYLDGLNLNLLYQTALYVGYLVGFGLKEDSAVKRIDKRPISGLNSLDKFLAVLAVIILVIMFSVGGLSLLAPFRDVSISVLFPQLRPIYPIAMILGAILAGRGILLIGVNSHYLAGCAIFLIGISTSVVTNQRGLLVIFIFTAIGFLVRIGKHIIAFTAFGAAFSLAMTVRSFIFLVLGEKNEKSVSVGPVNYLAALPYSPDGDSSEVWMVVSKYVDQNGLLMGKSIIMSWASLFSSEYRYSSGYRTGADVLNSFHDPTTYWNLKFGFNVSTAHELFFNFGYTSIIFYFIFAWLIGVCFRRYYNLLADGADPIYSSLFVFAVATYLMAISGLMWFLLYFIIHLGFQWFSRHFLIQNKFQTSGINHK